jgi:hypothetical protein
MAKRSPTHATGLTLFGPLDEVHSIRYGIVGTRPSVERFNRWLARLQQPIINDYTGVTRPYYPGFAAAFHTIWEPAPTTAVIIEEHELLRRVHIDDKYQRTHQTVNLFADAIRKAQREEEATPLIWFVLITDEVYKFCRPKSIVPTLDRVIAADTLPPRFAKRFTDDTPSLFPQINTASLPYQYDADFHHQLKAQLLTTGVPTQIIRESTIAHHDFTTSTGNPKRRLDPVISDIAWHLSTGTFYKAGGRPWKIANIRSGVCYLGLVFKKDDRDADPRAACCAAQMFLDNGDGVVFRGALGPWYSAEERTFHLTTNKAAELLRTAITSYTEKLGSAPKELFIHGKIAFDDAEWQGFTSVTPPGTNVVGIRIKKADALKLYTRGDHPVLRGTAYYEDDRGAFLWTKGFVPRLQTYPGRGVPNPLRIDIVRGEADLTTVLNDVMALTKVNYNSCIFADGIPVTLRFADAIGEILTAGPATETIPPLPFKMYI